KAKVMSRPSGPSGLVFAKRCGGSHVVIVDSIVKPGSFVRRAPPSLGSSSFSPIHQPSIAAPFESASQTWSGVALMVCSPRTSKGWAISAFLRQLGRLGRRDIRHGQARDAGMDRDDDPMRSTAGGGLVVVLRDKGCNRVRELLGERRAIRGGREPDLAIEGE